MVAVTYGAGRVPAAEAAPKAAAPRKSWLVRFYNALVAARMESARREVMMHAHLLPPSSLHEFRKGATKTRSDDMPFGGW